MVKFRSWITLTSHGKGYASNTISKAQKGMSPVLLGMLYVSLLHSLI